MNILFLTISRLTDISDHNIYNDLMREFKKNGHVVYIVSPRERRYNESTTCEEKEGVYYLGVKTLNLIKTNVIEKGIGQVLLESQFKRNITRFLGQVHFDIILYSTPPITFSNVVKHLKKHNPQAITYLMLKDIFPQNAVDMKMFSSRSIIYKYFRKKETALYQLSDYIGCMSPSNVAYLKKHNSTISPERIEICANSIELIEHPKLNLEERNRIRETYHLPQNKKIFVYGGNLGRPQGIDFFVNCLNNNKLREDCHFLIVGSGVESYKITNWLTTEKPKNVTFIDYLPKNEYDNLVQSCDVGLIFLDYNFTIPNFPSRLLTYLEYKIPVISATDEVSDVGKISMENGFGLWCRSNDVESFSKCVSQYVENFELVEKQGNNGYKFLSENYIVEKNYNTIISHVKSSIP